MSDSETPSPVPAPSDGGNASETASQGVETGNRDRFDNPVGSERPDAGRETGSWYATAMREHDRANVAELDRNAAAQRASSWWEAAKTLRRQVLRTLRRAEAAEEGLHKLTAELDGARIELAATQIVLAKVRREVQAAVHDFRNGPRQGDADALAARVETAVTHPAKRHSPEES